MKSLPSILLIENDAVDVERARRALARNQMNVLMHVAGNGEEALAFLRHASESPAVAPDIILLDLNMPVMSGYEFLDEVKQDPKLKSIPVVVLTTSASEPDRRYCFQRSAAGYIVKPIDFHEFAEAMAIIVQYWSLSEFSEHCSSS